MPARVLAVDAGGATVEIDTLRRRASTLLMPGVAVGDWVLVASGTIVRRLAPVEAREITQALHAAIALEDAEQVERPPLSAGTD